jgi:hypothetical protein
VTERWSYIPDLLEENLDELGFLWGRRVTALRSTLHTPRSVAALEERIRARLQGVLAVADRALPDIERRLWAHDPDPTFAAAFALLHRSAFMHAPLVFEAFRDAAEDPPRLQVLRDALAHSPLDGAVPLHTLVSASDALLAAAATHILALHSAIEPAAASLERLIMHESEEVRLAGWRLVPLLGADVYTRWFIAGTEAPEPAVRAATMEAGAWGRARRVLSVGQTLANSPSPDAIDALYVYAVLAPPTDLPLFQRLATAAELGPERFRLLAAFGHPALLRDILPALADPDPAVAAAAGTAFTALTGIDVESDRRAAVRPPGAPEPDAFEAEFQEEVTLPDPELAARRWHEFAPRWNQAQR